MASTGQASPLPDQPVLKNTAATTDTYGPVTGRVFAMQCGTSKALSADHLGHLVILDEIHRAPGLFPILRGLIDRARSLRWRQDFIRSYLERDVPQFGRRIPAETLRRFWGMLAHLQGGRLNVAQLARNLGVDAKTAAAYIDLLVDLLLVRRLPPWHANVGKRLVRSPKVFVRDSGLAHALLAIGDKETLLSHPVLGASWEGFVIEQILAVAPEGVQGHFYRTSGGAEIDLLLSFPGGCLWAVEVKRSLAPRPEKGFHSACADLRPERRFVVYPGEDTYRAGNETDVISLPALARPPRSAAADPRAGPVRARHRESADTERGGWCLRPRRHSAPA